MYTIAEVKLKVDYYCDDLGFWKRKLPKSGWKKIQKRIDDDEINFKGTVESWFEVGEVTKTKATSWKVDGEIISVTLEAIEGKFSEDNNEEIEENVSIDFGIDTWMEGDIVLYPRDEDPEFDGDSVLEFTPSLESIHYS